jgi:hypothetical protein
MTCELNEVSKNIPDFNHVVDCFNKDPKWEMDSLYLDMHYVHNVEALVEFMTKNGLRYLDAIEMINWH